MGPLQTPLAVLLGILIFSGVLEGGARLYWGTRPSGNSIPIDFDGGFSESSRLFVPDPQTPGGLVTSPMKAHFHTQRFLRVKPKGTCRIAILGESSVNYLEPEFELLRPRLRNELSGRCSQVELINAGGKSYGSHRLTLVARELLNYDLDLLVAYLGNNEFEEMEQLELVHPGTAWISRLAMHSVLIRELTQAVLRARVSQLEREHRDRLLSIGPDIAHAWKHSFSKDEIAQRMSAFENNLESIARDFARAKVPLVLTTIPSNLVVPLLPREDYDRYQPVRNLIATGDYVKARALGRELLKTVAGRHQSSDFENDALRRVASAYGLPLVDIEGAVAEAEPHHLPGETLFSDHCHLNANGNRLWIQTIEPVLIAIYGKTSKVRDFVPN